MSDNRIDRLQNLLPLRAYASFHRWRNVMATLGIYLPTVMFISLVGGFLPLLREMSQRALALLLSFSAGVLLGAVFFHMLPETGKVLNEAIGWGGLAGLLFFFLLDRFALLPP